MSCCLINVKEPCLPYYLSIVGGRIVGVIHFPRVLVQCEIQTASFRIWTRLVSISNCDSDYTTGTKRMIVKNWTTTADSGQRKDKYRRPVLSCWTNDNDKSFYVTDFVLIHEQYRPRDLDVKRSRIYSTWECEWPGFVWAF